MRKQKILAAACVALASVALIAGCAKKAETVEPKPSAEATSSDASESTEPGAEDATEGAEALVEGPAAIDLSRKNENVSYFITIDDGEQRDITKFIREYHNERPYITTEGMAYIFGMTKGDVTDEQRQALDSVVTENGETAGDAKYETYSNSNYTLAFKSGLDAILVGDIVTQTGDETIVENGEMLVSLTAVSFNMGIERVGSTTDNGGVVFSLYTPGAYEDAVAEPVEETEPLEDGAVVETDTAAGEAAESGEADEETGAVEAEVAGDSADVDADAEEADAAESASAE